MSDPTDGAARAGAPSAHTLEKKLAHAMGRAIADFAMIAQGDRVMVAVSGGKDSYTLLHLLRALRKKAPVDFELKVVNIDQGHPGYPAHRLRDYMAREKHDFTMILEDTYSIVTEKIPSGNTYLLALLAPSPRHPLSRGHRARLHEDRARPPS